MQHWIIAPIILPALMGPFITLAMRHDVTLQRVASLASAVLLVGLTGALLVSAAGGNVESYELGSWPAPFGIVLVLDRLSALMVTLTAVLGLVVLAYAVATNWDQRGRNFHALYQFQLMGLFGAMLTGDIFNLFVFFEILLIASYGLMTHGGGRMRLRGGVQYVIYNLAGSTLFLFALGTLYAVFGTLNMADLAERAAELPAGDGALLRVTAVLLLLVFVLKGALLPMHFWLPNTYALAPAPVAALFAVMTKVGAYSVIRVFTLIFPVTLAPMGGLVADVVVPAALVTLAIGMIGVLGGGTLARTVSFAAIGSMGTLFLAIGTFSELATGAALYYLIHSTLATAALFLVVDQVRARRGNSALVPQAPLVRSGLVAAFFFAAAIAMAGMPPLSGFLGKLMVLQAVRQADWWVWGWAFILVTSLIAVVGFARAGSVLFWRPHDNNTPAPSDEFQIAPGTLSGWGMAALGGLLALIVALTVAAGPVTGYTNATAAQLYAPQGYIYAVLGTPEERAARLAAEEARADDLHGADHGAPAHSDAPATSEGH
ncbi:monovalent cation/H+ antiporter subunit D [Pararhodobacter aggregans]|uniref:Monovalent cation/H+ antiporter subunit D n=1 Tax=Pararhodobacter aggregans TaxID=404875 RepID=A0A2T7UUI2_9RHOB|nr:monovalent cation/H+ antiporter subunit D [Pararhodobacter aggregans]PTX04229.1 multisubunit potassium/proton antiporter PhaD subunit [Pararhodobacter aggregans]PVE48324.1 monovalent cation/H+ antiporter subunit D [Pararhodobacter aggregans]